MINIMPTYGRIDLSFERGEGPWLFTEDGRKYLDFASGIAVNTLGHSNKELINVLIEQSKKVWHTSNLYNIKPQSDLAKLICQNSFGESVFFCNSGAESLEGTIKLCRRFHFNNGDRNKTFILPGILESTGQPNTLQINNSQYYFSNLLFGPKELTIYDASVLRLQEVSLSYSLPRAVLDKTPFGALSITASGFNLWYDAYNTPDAANFDPNVAGVGVGNGRGFDYLNGPSTKRYGLSVKLSF